MELTRPTRLITLPLLAGLAALTLFAATQQPPTSGGGVAVATPLYRVVRAVSGTKSQQQGGRLIIEDPRTVFYVPEDKQIIVYFEWEGPTGPHTFEALWKNPEGKIVVISDFKYEAKEKRFGGYWSMVLSETTPTGLWAVETRIDGEAAGAHPFQILATARPPDAIPSRRVQTPQEIYQRALAATVSVEKLSAAGMRIGSGAGFFTGSRLVSTPFHVIDGASALRIVLPDGRRQDVLGVVAWSRKQDWALLRTAADGPATLERGNAPNPVVGDRCYTLDVGTASNRVLSETEVTGNFVAPGAGERWNLAASLMAGASGAPVLNEYGELIGMGGVSLIPGAESLDVQRFGMPASLSTARGPLQGSLVLPASLLPSPGPEAKATSLEELMKTGQFVPPITAARHVLYGSLGGSIEKRQQFPEVVDIRSEFSRRDKKMALLVMWDPKEKLKTSVALKFYDVENRLIGDGKPQKFNAGRNDRSYHTWEIPIEGIKPGFYRLDVVLGDETAYRTFFRIAE